MKIEITKLEAIINTSKKIIASRKKITKIDAVYLDSSNSQSKINNARNKAQIEFEYIEDMMHELHCLSVEIGVAEKEAERYGEKAVTSSNGWSTLKKQKREPQL